MDPDQKTDAPPYTEVQPVSIVRRTPVIWASVALSLLALVAWVAYDVFNDRAVLIKNEQDRILTQARVITTNLEHQTESVARVFRTLAAAPGAGGMDQRLSELCRAMPGIRTLLILDRAGRVVASNRKETLQRDFSGRDYFSIPRKQQRAETLYVSPPFTAVTGKFVINLSVMITGRDGSFDGVVGASLDPDYFAVLLKSVHFSSSGMWSSIIHGDGLMFMMVPETARAEGSNLAVPGTFYTRHMTSGMSENVYSGTSGISGTRRIIAMKTFNPPGLHLSKPLIIAVSRDADAVLTDWRRDSFFKFLSIFLLAGFIVLSTVYLLRRRRIFDQQELQLFEQQVTARHEIRLAQESQKYAAIIQGILESTTAAVFSVDTSFCYSSFNQSHAKIMKSLYATDIEAGCCLFDYMPAEDAAAARTNLERAMTGEAFTVEAELGGTACQRTYYEISHNPIAAADGRITGVAVFAYDTTERRLLLNSLRETNELFDLFMRYSPFYSFIKEVSATESRVLRASGNYVTMIGIPADEMIGRSMAELFPPELARKITDDDWAVVSSGQVLEVEEELNGRRYTTVKFPLAKEKKSFLAGFTIDITERNQAEEALRKSKEQFDNLACRINVGIYILHSTPDGTHWLDYVSPRMAELVGCSIESLLADCRIWFNNIHPEDRDCLAKVNQEGIALRRPFDWNGRILADGAVRWLHIQSSPESLANGDVLWHGVITDITERKLIEERLQKRDAEIEQFIYTVSHDLRSPLVTVKTFLGYLECDMTTGDQERITQDLHFIHGAADKMKILLDELLELSRIDRLETLPTKVSLREVLDGVLGDLAGVISERRVDIRLPDTDLILFGDRLRFSQIWQNLIENAIKYSLDGTPPLIALGSQQEGGETVFFIRDTGIGIDPHYHRKVFGIFEKLDPESSGVGLGLSMIQRIVEKYGGRIWVESEGTGQGSCFRFTLPDALVRTE